MTEIGYSKDQEEGKRVPNHQSCFVVEQVAGVMIYTCWDKEEAFQFANRLIMLGKETRNSVAIRKVACSLLRPPATESGVLLESMSASRTIENEGAIVCRANTFPALGYCVERFPVPHESDLGSITRRKYRDHLIVRIAKKGLWDPIHEKYLGKPTVVEIWHPGNGGKCVHSSSIVRDRIGQ